MLSRRQAFTALDEKITRILLEIDGLERSHHGTGNNALLFTFHSAIEWSVTVPLLGERRRAAVNRALRLSDSIERLKTDMIEEVCCNDSAIPHHHSSFCPFAHVPSFSTPGDFHR